MNEPKNYPTIGILSFAHTINDMYGNYIPALLPFLVISFGSFPLLVFIAGLAGLGTAAFHPQASTMISNIGGRKKAILLSFFVAFGNIGFALSLLIFPPFFHKFGLGSTPFTVIPGLIVAILLFFFAPKAEYLKGTATNLKEVFGTLRTSSKELILIIFIIAIRALTYSGLLTIFPLYFSTKSLLISWNNLMFIMLFILPVLAGILALFMKNRPPAYLERTSNSI